MNKQYEVVGMAIAIISFLVLTSCVIVSDSSLYEGVAIMLAYVTFAIWFIIDTGE
mgnify:CR=1 FL=1